MHLLQGKPPPEEWTWWRVLVAVLSFQGVAFVLIHRFLREHQMTWSEAFNFKLHWPSALTFGLMTGLAIVPVVLLLQFSVQLVLSRFGLAPDEQTAVQVIRNAESWPGRLVMGFATILLVPPAEELLFRGIAYPAIKRAGYPRLALWGTSVLFAAIHGNLAILAPLTLLAMALVWLYEKTGNLLAPIAAHSLFNAINFGLVYALPWLQERVPSVFQQP
jgi:membrane protease YdiL (CAAX protease family)